MNMNVRSVPTADIKKIDRDLNNISDHNATTFL